MSILPLVQKLKDSDLLDGSFETSRAGAVSFESGSTSHDEDDLKDRLFDLAVVVKEGLSDGRLTFYEIFSVGVAFIRLLKTPSKTSVSSSDVPKRSSRKKKS